MNEIRLRGEVCYQNSFCGSIVYVWQSSGICCGGPMKISVFRSHGSFYFSCWICVTHIGVHELSVGVVLVFDGIFP